MTVTYYSEESSARLRFQASFFGDETVDGFCLQRIYLVSYREAQNHYPFQI